MNKGFTLGDNSSQNKQSNIDAVKKSRHQEKSPAPKGVGPLKKGDEIEVFSSEIGSSQWTVN